MGLGSGKEETMDQPLMEMPKQVYAEPTLEDREHLDEVVWGFPAEIGLGTTGTLK